MIRIGRHVEFTFLLTAYAQFLAQAFHSMKRGGYTICRLTLLEVVPRHTFRVYVGVRLGFPPQDARLPEDVRLPAAVLREDDPATHNSQQVIRHKSGTSMARGNPLVVAPASRTSLYFLGETSMPQGHSHTTTELKLLLLNEGASPKNICTKRALFSVKVRRRFF
jgi:hypothetical protein